MGTTSQRGGENPRLAEGVDLIGEYEDSGYRDPPSIARRGDGQVVQLSRLLFLIAERADGTRSTAQIAEEVSERYGRGVSRENVEQLLEEKLRPLGVLVGEDGSQPETEKSNPLLALRFKAAIADERKTRWLTNLFKPLFLPPVVLAALAAFVAMDVWVFGIHGIAQSTRELLYQPANMLVVLALIMASAGFHEFGHAAALRYGGGTPGVMGAGVYVVWPAFYTDVTDAYRLDRRARLRTDLGGVYFNVVFALATFGAYLLTGYEVLLLLVPIQHLQILQQLMPVLRMDGYYILADLTGVPDLFARIKPVLLSVLPWKKKDESVTALKPWVRRVVTLWVLAIVPLLLYGLVLTVIALPRVAATAWDSAGKQLDGVSSAFADGDVLKAITSIIGLVLLALPLAGMVYTLVRLSSRAWKGGWNATADRPVLRFLFVVASASAAVLALWQWMPNGEYRPIQRGERGTVAESIRAVRGFGTGRAGLTPERERELGGAPFLSDAADEPAEEPAGADDEAPDTTTTTAVHEQTNTGSKTGKDSTVTTEAESTTTTEPETTSTTEAVQ